MNDLLSVRDLAVTYHRRRHGPAAPAVEEVSFRLGHGETVGLVGESGSGKTTIGMAVLGLVRATRGRVDAAGWAVTDFRGRVPRAFRRDVQVVWQDPYSTLTPHLRVRQLLDEPLRTHFDLTSVERRVRCEELLDSVGLPARVLGRRAHELSGGQRQRIAIARALAVEPRLIVLDEPVSALDVLTQSQVLRVLEDVQTRTRVGYLFISHDLAVVRHLAQRVVVLHGGRVKETGPVDDVCDHPSDPYTRQLVRSVIEPAHHQSEEAACTKQES